MGILLIEGRSTLLEPAHYVEVDAVEMDLRVSQVAAVATDGESARKNSTTPGIGRRSPGHAE
jgi:hypothetical protein